MRVWLAWISVVVFSVALRASQAQACINSYTQEYVVRGVRERMNAAEAALARGDNLTALRIANGVVLHGTSSNPTEIESAPGHTLRGEDAARLLARARGLRGIAMARLDGRVSARMTLLRRISAAQREENFRAALYDVGTARVSAISDPRWLAYQAELEARWQSSSAAASLATLRRLATSDVLSDAFSFVMLAQLETDAPARTHALQQCAARVGANARRRCLVR